MAPMRLPVYSTLQIVRRIALVWAAEALALERLGRAVDGLHLAGWRASVAAVAVIGLLNALVRPALVFLTMPFTLVTFGFLALGLNAIMVSLAALIVPGFDVRGFGPAMLAALGLAAGNTLFSSLFRLGDEHSFYRNLMRHLRRRAMRAGDAGAPGIVFIEIDGLAREILDEAIARGSMPELARWIASGSHRLASWDCGLPSQTSSSQAGILHGRVDDIPGFRWYDRDHRRLVVSNHPADAAWIEQRVSTGEGLLRGGVSVCNMLSGDADLAVATMSTYSRHRSPRVARAWFDYVVNPYTFTRSLLLMAWEIVREWKQAAVARLRRVRPRVSRGGWFPLLRAVTTVFQRDVSVELLVSRMFAGTPVAYTTFLGYDVVAHHAGPRRSDAFGVLRDIDRRIRTLRRAAADAPRRYAFVVLSDHGQTPSVPFAERFGQRFEDVVHELLEGGGHARAAVGAADGWGHVNAVLTEAIHAPSRTGRAARRLLRRRTHAGYVDLSAPRRRATRRRRLMRAAAGQTARTRREAAAVRAAGETVAETADVIVCPSGGLAHVYLTDEPRRVDLSRLATRYPRLVEGLVVHPGVEFVLVHSHEHGAVVLGRKGVHYLDEGRVEGDDPLAPFGPGAVGHLRRLDGFAHSGDLIVNGRWDPQSGVAITFEDQVGTHGGLGGPQTEPFVLYPSSWTLSEPVDDPVALHRQFMAWRRRLQAGADAPDSVERPGAPAL